ncbi:uncharacterized protein [Rutidosis leptorrhynchoides]|uniref:uncharacterized protein n=1 Tax=Rutidosis leptorrhynchoides TaxID=125765 RepID=UPI003A9A216F
MGFGLKWSNWISSCLSSASVSILLNGSLTDEFALRMGIHQGDPLSPYLFIIVAEGLNAMIKQALHANLIKGVNSNMVESMASRFRCQVGVFPFMYLGLPIGCKMKNIREWEPYIEKFHKRLDSWKARKQGDN